MEKCCLESSNNFFYDGQPRGQLIEVHLADLHFGAFNPKTQYDILMEQFYQPISQLPRIDIISILGSCDTEV